MTAAPGPRGPTPWTPWAGSSPGTLSGGDPDLPQQPWSTTKFLAIANAASRLRIASSYAVGLTADAGGYRLGDLVTSVHAYDDDPFSSNGLGRWFHDIGGRERANALIHALWLGRRTTSP